MYININIYIYVYIYTLYKRGISMILPDDHGIPRGRKKPLSTGHVAMERSWVPKVIHGLLMRLGILGLPIGKSI